MLELPFLERRLRIGQQAEEFAFDPMFHHEDTSHCYLGNVYEKDVENIRGSWSGDIRTINKHCPTL
jgi:hypothetical protein